MKVYSLIRVIDGKWEVVLHIRRNEDWRFQYEPRPDLRAIIDDNYDIEPDEMAKLLLDSVLDCEAVEVQTLAGQGVVIKRTSKADER